MAFAAEKAVSSAASRAEEASSCSSAVLTPDGDEACSGDTGPGVRVYTERQGPMPIWQQALAVATLLGFMGIIYVLAALLLAAPFSRAAALLAAAAWGTLLLPRGPLPWRAALASPVFALWRRYFDYSVLYEVKLDPSQHYLFADYPHGAFPLSQLLGLTVRHRAAWEGDKFFGFAADAAFRIPLWRHVYSWLGIVPASAANVRRYFKWGSVAVTPGGIREMYLGGRPGHGRADHIYISGRKGFVRLAVTEGMSIVPVYHLGATQILGFGPAWLESYGRRWRFSLGLLHGVAGLPLPRRLPLMMCVGAPLAVEKLPPSDPRFEAAVDEAHARYVAALRGMFERHKAAYGWPDRELVMH
ncbi:DGAT2D [Scenedesmus sp. PABB004]|nr:DGAT2D [Scenedesmus sp. PABB004]